MIITKSFIDNLVDHDNIQKYRSGNMEYHMPEHVKRFAYTLVGANHREATKMINNQRGKELEANLGNYVKANKHFVLAYALAREIDYGIEAGEEVKYKWGDREYVTEFIKQEGAQGIVKRYGNVPMELLYKVDEFTGEPEQLDLGI